MESADTLCFGNALVLFVEVTTPIETREVSACEYVFDGILVERPRVHIRVKTQFIYRSEEETFAHFPGLTCSHPSCCCLFERHICRVGCKSLYCDVKRGVGILKVLIGGKHDDVNIVGNNRLEFRFAFKAFDS